MHFDRLVLPRVRQAGSASGAFGSLAVAGMVRVWLGVLTLLLALAGSTGMASAASPPEITGLTPSSAPWQSDPTLGATEIVGTGLAGWADGQVSVTVGGEPALMVILNAEGTISIAFWSPAAPGPVDIIVTTPDGTSAIGAPSTFTWLPPPSTDATLSGLSADVGTFQEAFGTRTVGAANGAGCNVTYQVDVLYSAASVAVTPTATDSAASITVNGTAVGSGTASDPIAVGVGNNFSLVKVAVTAEDETTALTYCLTVNRAAAPITAPFSGLSISPGALDQPFSTSRNNYTATLSASPATLSWTTDYVDPTIVVSYTVGSDTTVVPGAVNGDGLSTTIPLAAGTVTKVSITSAQSGGSATENYQINITRGAAGTNAELAGLSPSVGTLSPAFAADTFAYAVAVDNATSSLTLTPTLADSNATVTVNGATPATPVTLAVGETAIDVVVTAEDGTTAETYTVTVTRAPPAPTISSVVPATGPVAGGSAVIITGTGFTDMTGVAFGSAVATDALVVSDTEISLTLPAGTRGAVDVAVTAPGGTATAEAAFTYVTAPVAQPNAVTVAANSVDNVIEFQLTGDAATAIAVATAAGHGAATVDGANFAYTPVAGYSGPDSFTYTASNAGGTSSAATISITVTAPTLVLSPAQAALPAGTVGVAYAQTITASAGGGGYDYQVTSGDLPDGLELDPESGAISGTPTVADDFAFTVTVTDIYEAIGFMAYTIHITAAEPSTLVLTPAGGALPDAMAGADYASGVSASGATGVVIYEVTAGALPAGLILNQSTGALNGPLDPGATPGDYSFTIRAHDNGGGGSISGNFTLKVAALAVTAPNKAQDVPAGADPTNIELTTGATGGPFTEAAVVSVTPPSAGTASIVGSLVAGPPAAGLYLKFVRTPGFVGRVVVAYTLTSTLGTSNIGNVTYNFAVDAAVAATEVDNLVQGFVADRQALLASTIRLPGLIDRRSMGSGGPVDARLSPYGGDGMQLNFATSLTQLQAYGAAADATALPQTPEQQRFNIWVSGTAGIQTSGDAAAGWGNFALLSAGIDYLLNEQALVGLSFNLDHVTDPIDADAQLTGNGWLVGPYGSFEIAEGVFLDTSLLYGGSANEIDTGDVSGGFDTTRWMFDTSLYGQLRLDAATTLTPKLRVVYLDETVADYQVTDGVGTVIAMPGFTDQQLRVSLGTELTHEFVLDDGLRVIPTIGVTGGLSALDDATAFGSMSAKVRITDSGDWQIETGLLLNFDANARQSVGGKVGFGGRF